MSKRMIITTAVLSCLLCTSCAAAEKAEIPDLKGDMSVSGRVACDGVTAQAEFTRSARCMDRKLYFSGQREGAYRDR